MPIVIIFIIVIYAIDHVTFINKYLLTYEMPTHA
jgi:hypothetical protein